MGFLDNLFNGDDSKKKKNASSNPLTNMFGNQQSFHGAGQSLGGSKPGTVISIALTEPGPLGVRVERRPNSEGTAIVHSIVEGGQSDRAGLKRGDILCFAGTNGQDEIMYDMFLEMAKSTQRPIRKFVSEYIYIYIQYIYETLFLIVDAHATILILSLYVSWQ